MIKVVWICHFSNPMIREHLKLKKTTFLQKLLGKQRKPYIDFAGWINNMITQFEKFNDIDLHIIVPHKGMKRIVQEFEINNIKYHFFMGDIYNIIYFFFKKKKKKYLINRKIINYLTMKINPDIVNVFGTENPYYSYVALDMRNVPVFISIQTIYSNPLNNKFIKNLQNHRIELEKDIIKKNKYFGCIGRLYFDSIIELNKDAKIFKLFYPISRYETQILDRKDFDVVFFAVHVTEVKGIEDALNALKRVKKDLPNVKMNIVGIVSSEYKKRLVHLIDSLGLTTNISFTDFFPSHDELIIHIQRGKIAVLPAKLDIIAGTIVESILVKIPVVAYITSGTPYLNKDGEVIKLCQIGDIKKLSENILTLLQDPKQAKKIAEQAYDFVNREFDDYKNCRKLANDYKLVIDDYTNKHPIPKENLFNIHEFPKYDKL